MPFGRSSKSSTIRSAKSDSAIHQQEYDKRTNQKVIYKCAVCALDRTLFDSRDPLQQDKLSDLLRSHLKERQNHNIQVICLQDRLVFRKKLKLKSLFRNHLMYKDIQYCFQCTEYPHILMLAVKSDIPNSNYIETYKCKFPEDVNSLSDVIYQASRQPDKTIHDIPPMRSIPSMDATSQKSKSMSYIDTQTSVDVLSKNPLQRSLSHSLNDGWNTPKIHDESPFHSPVQSPVRSPLLSYQSPVYTSISRDSRLKPLVVTPVNTINTSAYVSDTNDMNTNTTYFDYDPIRGPQINEVGPIYMFMVRHPSQHDMTNFVHEA
ncbi:hypothetical protein EWB00_005441 [Schistosoma japonicum]|uniref:SJCHGC05774 protein n=1 Tax=Schistosoma japonicum TaxID=6182 RepID=Q5D8Q9_SCHJA|nr:SJCHGC05774 protein [Schistosoma japonicum]TNN20076.1 hypothetical protein EWB00_005441 [Schistosoma japonicum]